MARRRGERAPGALPPARLPALDPGHGAGGDGHLVGLRAAVLAVQLAARSAAAPLGARLLPLGGAGRRLLGAGVLPAPLVPRRRAPLGGDLPRPGRGRSRARRRARARDPRLPDVGRLRARDHVARRLRRRRRAAPPLRADAGHRGLQDPGARARHRAGGRPVRLPLSRVAARPAAAAFRRAVGGGAARGTPRPAAREGLRLLGDHHAHGARAARHHLLQPRRARARGADRPAHPRRGAARRGRPAGAGRRTRARGGLVARAGRPHAARPLGLRPPGRPRGRGDRGDGRDTAARRRGLPAFGDGRDPLRTRRDPGGPGVRATRGCLHARRSGRADRRGGVPS